MDNLFFVNTFFEEELLHPGSLGELLCRHPVYLQLHYLSCLVAKEPQIPLLAFAPEPDFFSRLETMGLAPSGCHFLDNVPNGMKLHSWGPSEALDNFAKTGGHFYEIPGLNLVREINSKAFSFQISPKLEKAELLHSMEEIIDWHGRVQGPKVFKTLQGSSGRGHLIVEDSDLPKVLRFFQKQTSCSVVAEPWVDRVLDFSTQWEIDQKTQCHYVGATLCLNSKRGCYKQSIVGPEEFLFKDHWNFFQEHIVQAKKVVENIASLGFFGSLGLDAMIYKKNGELLLHPIVEINARKTMGWAALTLYQKLKWSEPACFCYEMKKTSDLNLLPNFAIKESLGKVLLPGQLLVKKLCF
jgi:hypothetical protein